MECPACQHAKTEVSNSRRTKENTQVWRRRRCPNCKHLFTTYESIDLGFCTVLKRNGGSETYDYAKLFSSVQRACQHLQDDIAATTEAITKTIERKLIKEIGQDGSVTTETITRQVAQTLKNYNLNAFMRYLANHQAVANSKQLDELIEQYAD